MTIDIDRAKRALDSLQRERQEQQHRLQLAAEAKQRIDETNTQRTLANRKRAL